MAEKFKRGDKIKVTIGKDKGREGTIEKILTKKNLALVPGVNIYKKHVKAAMTQDKKGGIFEIPRPLAFSKIALVCASCKKITRAGFLVKEGKKIRICRKCGKELK